MGNGMPCQADDGQDAVIMVTDLVNGGNITLCADHLVAYCSDIIDGYLAANPTPAAPEPVTSSGGDTDTDDEDADDQVTAPVSTPQAVMIEEAADGTRYEVDADGEEHELDDEGNRVDTDPAPAGHVE